MPTISAKASTAAPATVPISPTSAPVSGACSSFNATTDATHANSASTSVTNPRNRPSTAAPPIARSTSMSSAVRPMGRQLGGMPRRR